MLPLVPQHRIIIVEMAVGGLVEIVNNSRKLLSREFAVETLHLVREPEVEDHSLGYSGRMLQQKKVMHMFRLMKRQETWLIYIKPHTHLVSLLSERITM
jgi:hypothetical protein